MDCSSRTAQMCGFAAPHPCHGLASEMYARLVLARISAMSLSVACITLGNIKARSTFLNQDSDTRAHNNNPLPWDSLRHAISRAKQLHQGRTGAKHGRHHHHPARMVNSPERNQTTLERLPNPAARSGSGTLIRELPKWSTMSRLLLVSSMKPLTRQPPPPARAPR